MRAIAPVLCVITLGLGACVTPPAPPVPFTVKVIGFNDYHGNLESPGTFSVNSAAPAAQRPPVGGADYIAGHLARLKAQNPLNVVVGAGDVVGASPMVSALFHDEPAIETLNRIGLEFNAVGNHEFDDGATELLRMQNGGCKGNNGTTDRDSCRGAETGTPVPFEGAHFRYLSANVVAAATGKTLFPAWGIKTFNGVRMAFIGMTLQATPGIVSPSGVAGLNFLDEADTVNALVADLRRENVESIVVLVHQGGYQTGTLADINGCEGGLAGSAIAGIVRRLDDAVDLVVSGHTHNAYNCRLPNAAGRAIPVSSASAFGRVLTDIDVTVDPATRDVTAVTVTNRLVDRTDPGVTPDASIRDIVARYKALVTPVANRVIGTIATDLPNSPEDSACNMRAGELVADSELAATNEPDLGGAHIAFINPGGVRNPGFTWRGSPAGEGDGAVTYGEAYTVLPFGNSLVTMSLTTRDIKDFLEEQFAGCRGQSATATRLMVPSAGFKYAWNGAKACDARISDVTLTLDGRTEVLVDANGVVLEPSRTWRVTVNSFIASGGDGFTTFLRGTDPLGGVQDIDALASWLARFPTRAQAYAPGTHPDDRNAPRIRRHGGSSCPGGSDVNP